MLPKGWTEKRINDVCKIYVGRDLREDCFDKERSEIFEHPVYSNSVEKKGLYGFYNFPEFSGIALTVVGRGAGLGTAFTRVGSFGAIGRLLVLFPNETTDAHYLTEFINNKIRFYVESSGIPQLTGEQIGKYQVPLPPIPEQRQIAAILSTWDEAIEKTESLIEGQGKRFSWLLNRLINQGRVKGDWRRVKLGEVAEIAMKKKLLTVKGETLLTVKLHCKGIEKNSRIEPKLTESGRPYYKRAAGEFLIGRQNFHNGGFGIVPPELDGLIASNAITSLEIRKNKLNADFLFYFLSRPTYYKRIGHIMDGTGQKELSDKQILDLMLIVPSAEQQKQIAETLDTAQQEIDLLKRQAEAYRKQKRGLMQKLLTGEWRVKIREEV